MNFNNYLTEAGIKVTRVYQPSDLIELYEDMKNTITGIGAWKTIKELDRDMGMRGKFIDVAEEIVETLRSLIELADKTGELR